MSEDSILAIILAFIGAVGVIMAAAVPAYLNILGKVTRAAEDSAISRDQLQNNHTTNLREEGDERHAEVVGAIQALSEKHDAHSRDIKGVRDEIGILYGADRSIRKDFADHLQNSNQAVARFDKASLILEKLNPAE